MCCLGHLLAFMLLWERIRGDRPNEICNWIYSVTAPTMFSHLAFYLSWYRGTSLIYFSHAGPHFLAKLAVCWLQRLSGNTSNGHLALRSHSRCLINCCQLVACWNLFKQLLSLVDPRHLIAGAACMFLSLGSGCTLLPYQAYSRHTHRPGSACFWFSTAAPTRQGWVWGLHVVKVCRWVILSKLVSLCEWNQKGTSRLSTWAVGFLSSSVTDLQSD